LGLHPDLLCEHSLKTLAAFMGPTSNGRGRERKQKGGNEMGEKMGGNGREERASQNLVPALIGL